MRAVVLNSLVRRPSLLLLHERMDCNMAIQVETSSSIQDPKTNQVAHFQYVIGT